MIKLCRIINMFISQSFSQTLAYRTTSIFIVVFGTLFSLGEVIGVFVYYSYTDNIFGWDKNAFLLLIGTFSLIQYIYQFLFVLQHEELMDKVIEGELDYDLIRPMDSQLLCSFRLLDIPSLINMIIPLALISYSIKNLDNSVHAIYFVQYILFIFIGVLFYYLLNQFFVSLSFWIERPGKLIGLPEYLFDLASRPRSVYPKYLQIIIVFIIPVVSATNTPVSFLRGSVDLTALFSLLIFTIIMFWVVRVQWIKGIKRYASTS